MARGKACLGAWTLRTTASPERDVGAGPLGTSATWLGLDRRLLALIRCGKDAPRRGQHTELALDGHPMTRFVHIL